MMQHVQLDGIESSVMRWVNSFRSQFQIQLQTVRWLDSTDHDERQLSGRRNSGVRCNPPFCCIQDCRFMIHFPAISHPTTCQYHYLHRLLFYL